MLLMQLGVLRRALRKESQIKLVAVVLLLTLYSLFDGTSRQASLGPARTPRA
jgi:hypothetical protein